MGHERGRSERGRGVRHEKLWDEMARVGLTEHRME